jgi:hypothetical protein
MNPPTGFPADGLEPNLLHALHHGAARTWTSGSSSPALKPTSAQELASLREHAIS